jgi:undecaprenyl-diphosphatase
LRPPLLVAAVLASTVAVILAVGAAGQSTGSPVDSWLHDHLSGTVLGSATGYRVGWVIGTAGDPPVAGALMFLLVVVCLFWKRRRLAVLAVAGPVLTGAVTSGLKPIVGRTIHGDHLSFPSGHTGQLAGLALVVGLLLVDVAGSARPAGTVVVLAAGAVGGAAVSVQ